MSKPILFYVLVRGFSYRNGFTVLGVTSERHGQIYGRTLPDDTITHVARRSLFYRFPDGTPPEFAIAAKARADKEWLRHEKGIQEAERRVASLRSHRENCVEDAAKGLSENPALGRQQIDPLPNCPECGEPEGSRKTQTGCGCIPL